MNSFKKLVNITGWIVFGISFIVFFFSAERTGSLWDCGEFILGAYKLQVVHPPGAPFFLIVGRLFTWVADLLSSNPSDIAFSVNLLSGICTAFAATFVAWTTIIFSRLALAGDTREITKGQSIAILFAGLTAGLTTSFTTSIWFSAVEGEVYAMSTMFTAMTFWMFAKWYNMPTSKQADKWLVMGAYAAGVSIGVHLLSILTLPAVALLYYFKKFKTHNLRGIILSLLFGVICIAFIQKIVIVGIPNLWKYFELFMVNSLGFPFHTGLIPTILLVSAIAFFLLRYAHKKGLYHLQLIVVAAIMITIGYSTMGVVVVRANADPPINMNVPSDVMRLIPYINREQYGERALLYGPHFDARPDDLTRKNRYGQVEDRYEIVDEKYSYIYNDPGDKILFPRIGHSEGGRSAVYRQWWGKDTGVPGMGFNLSFFIRYQLNWMYWRYFMWNFTGKQNGQQGYTPWDKSAGHWESGIKFVDEFKLYNKDELPETERKQKAKNHYYFLPLIFGIMGLYFHAKNRPREFGSLLTLFIITGIGIIVYSNQPPNEPRERDYVLAGSFFTFAMWIGMGVLFIYNLLKERLKLKDNVLAIIAGVLVLLAPLIMAFENYDDHSRIHHYASRDYAANFLESCEPNSIIFTYGDNDTYPLWYCQEVEGIRTDVRVVNLSLIAVDWYIDKLRSKVNDSPGLNLTISSEAYRGKNRNQVFFYSPDENLDSPRNIYEELRFIGDPRNSQQGQTIMRTKRLFIPVNRERAFESGMVTLADSTKIVPRIDISLTNNPNYITKDELAVLDVIASNMWERPIYFATTCKNEKLLGLNDYTQLEGLGLRIVPIRTQSDITISIYGSGRVDADRIYRNVMERFRWGNFDKKDLYVDNSYGAEIQSHRMIMMRACEEFVRRGEKQKAVELADKYFEAFPHFNFPYTPYVVPFITVYINSQENEKAKEHMRILARELADYLNFYDSIDDGIVKSSFETEYLYDLRGVRDVLNLSERMNDPEFAQEMKDLLGQYDIR